MHANRDCFFNYLINNNIIQIVALLKKRKRRGETVVGDKLCHIVTRARDFPIGKRLSVDAQLLEAVA